MDVLFVVVAVAFSLATSLILAAGTLWLVLRLTLGRVS